jgi:uncharacterized membrane protein YfcA
VPAWQVLDTSVRQQVLTLAASGKHHPDAAVAATAHAWAVERSRPLALVLPRAAILGIIDGLLGGGGGSGAVPLLDWRNARLLRRLGPPRNE